MNERSEYPGTRTTGNDPLQRSSGTAGGIPGEQQDTGYTGGDDSTLAGMTDHRSSTAMGSTGETGDTMGKAVGDKIDDMSEKLGDSATKISDKGKEGLETGKEKLGGGMESAADMIRERTGDTSGLPQEAGTKLADTMDKTATYLHEHSSEEIWSDVESYVREHPTQALVGAVLAGWVMARVLR